MAANAPASKAHHNNNNGRHDSSHSNSPVHHQPDEEDITDTTNLDLGMSRMKLGRQPQDPATSSSILPSFTAYTDEQQHENALTFSGIPNSPAGDRQTSSSSSAFIKSQGRPPGLGNPMPSPIGKTGGQHSKNTTATSPLLTLTPNSSVDGSNNAGGSDWHSLGRSTTSPFRPADVPTMPYLNADYNLNNIHNSNNNNNNSRLLAPPQADDSSGIASFGSYEVGEENDNDGLLGLEALRDKVHTSPLPAVTTFSTSPPSKRSVAMPSSYDSSIQHHDRMRLMSRDRPPLSQSSHNDTATTYPSDRSIGDRSVQSGGSYGAYSTSTQKVTESGNASVESNDSRGFGAIGRSELRLGASEFDPTRRRASSTDNFNYNYALGGHQQQPQQMTSSFEPPHVSQKFGSLPNIGFYLNQQQIPQQNRIPPGGSFTRDMSPSFSDVDKPKHVRSISQPVVTGHHLPTQSDSRFYPGQSLQQGQQQQYTSYQDTGFRQSNNRASFSHSSSLPGQYENPYAVKRGSMPNIASANTGHGYSGYPPLQRRDALEYHDRQTSMPNLLQSDDLRLFGTSTNVSPGHSPHQVHYAGHTRQPSDGSALHSTSSVSHGSGLPRSIYPKRNTGDDDHPLVGEHIEVPADHFSEESHFASRNLARSAPNSLLRSGLHGGALPVEHLPTHYIDPISQQHLPTAGANLPMPKVVYNVKFKRSQRNFVLGPRISRDLKVGTYVKVEADRGEDLGIVVGKIPAEKYNVNARSFTAGMGPPPGNFAAGTVDLKRIIRLATHDEVSLLTLKRDEEEELLRICRTKVRQRGLPMNVVDAEYQFDRHKLTFFFEAEGRVDFRELVRDLFSMYKTRIWMQQLDKNTSTSMPAIMTPPQSSLQMDYGTPIIAPTSEFAESLFFGNSPSSGDARSH